MPDELHSPIDDLPGDPSTREMRERMAEWVDRVISEDNQRLERGLEAQMGIIAASSHHTGGRAIDVDDDELTEETLRETLTEFRRQYQDVPEIPEWQRQIIQAIMEGRRIFVARGRRAGWHRVAQYLEEMGYVSPGTARIEAAPLPDGVVMLDPLDDDTPTVYQRERDAVLQDWLIASWFAAIRARHREEVPDEITAADRERWADSIDGEPTYQHADHEGASALSSDELLDAIGVAVDEWKDVRDGD